MITSEFIYLNQEDIIKAGGLNMKICMEAVEYALKCHVSGETILPDKVILRWGDVYSEDTEGLINAMPGYLGGDINLAGVKWVGSSPRNPKRHNIPRASALLILNDKETKLPIAIMEAAVISAMRTGAVGGVAAKYLAKKDSTTCGIIGAGIQARTQAMAIKEGVPAIKRFILYDLDQGQAAKWCREMSKFLDTPCEPMTSCEATVRESDIFVTATTSSTPFVKEEWIKPGQLELHVSGYEDETEVVGRADKIVVDDWKQVMHRDSQTICEAFHKGIIDDSSIDAELGEIALGEKPGRDNDEQFIYFNSVGMGTEDIAFGAKLLEAAKAKNLGHKLKLWDDPDWIANVK